MSNQHCILSLNDYQKFYISQFQVIKYQWTYFFSSLYFRLFLIQIGTHYLNVNLDKVWSIEQIWLIYIKVVRTVLNEVCNLYNGLKKKITLYFGRLLRSFFRDLSTCSFLLKGRKGTDYILFFGKKIVGLSLLWWFLLSSVFPSFSFTLTNYGRNSSIQLVVTLGRRRTTIDSIIKRYNEFE